MSTRVVLSPLNALHALTIPISSLPVLYVLSQRLGLLPDITQEEHPSPPARPSAVAMCGLSIDALYEIYEYIAGRHTRRPAALRTQRRVWSFFLRLALPPLDLPDAWLARG